MFHDIKVLNVYGGEPMANPIFDVIISDIRRLLPEAEMWLSTNGDMWRRHSATVIGFDKVIVTHYGDWTFPGCPDNTVVVDELRATLGDRLVVSRAEHMVGSPWRVDPCWREHFETLEFSQGILYPCCTGSGVKGARGIPPGLDWREKIREVRAVCGGCPFAI